MERLILPYPNFVLNTVIDPEEANANNADIKFKVDQLVDFINSVTSEGGEVSSINIRGNVVEITPIAPFTSDNVEDALVELIGRLTNSIEESGASLIGSSEIDGVSGSTIQDQLISLKELHDTLSDDVVYTSDLEVHKESGDHDERYYLKSSVDSLLDDVASSDTTTTTKIEVLNADPTDPDVGRIWLRGDL